MYCHAEKESNHIQGKDLILLFVVSEMQESDYVLWP
jgi:hypothetical protein